MKTIVVLALAAYCQAVAAQTWLNASLASYHFERGRGYCELNPGIGLAHELWRGVSLRAGSYEGSKCASVSYIGASAMWLELPSGVRAGGGIFGFIGYEKNRRAVLWAPVPALYVPIDARRGLSFPLFLPYHDFKGAIGTLLEVRFQ